MKHYKENVADAKREHKKAKRQIRINKRKETKKFEFQTKKRYELQVFFDTFVIKIAQFAKTESL